VKLKQGGNKLVVDHIPLAEAVGESKRRTLGDELFDFEKYWPTQKYLDYLEPILGKYKEPDSDYWELISSLNK